MALIRNTHIMTLVIALNFHDNVHEKGTPSVVQFLSVLHHWAHHCLPKCFHWCSIQVTVYDSEQPMETHQHLYDASPLSVVVEMVFCDWCNLHLSLTFPKLQSFGLTNPDPMEYTISNGTYKIESKSSLKMQDPAV